MLYHDELCVPFVGPQSSIGMQFIAVCSVTTTLSREFLTHLMDCGT
jgi:hypothetical protein